MPRYPVEQITKSHAHDEKSWLAKLASLKGNILPIISDKLTRRQREMNRVKVRSEERRMIEAEILRQKLEFGGSVLEVIDLTFAELMKSIDLEPLFQGESSMVTAVEPFNYNGLPYEMRIRAERSVNKDSLVFKLLILSSELANIQANNPEVSQKLISPPFSDANQDKGIVAVRKFVVSLHSNPETSSSQLYFDFKRVDREPRKQTDSSDQARANEIIFSGSGGSLIMLTNEIVRHVSAQNPFQFSSILAESMDLSKHADRGDKSPRTFLTSNILQYLGFTVVHPEYRLLRKEYTML